MDNYNNLDNNRELRQRLRADFFRRGGGNITVLERVTCQILPNSAIFYYLAYYLILSNTVLYCFLLFAHLLLARLLLAPWRPTLPIYLYKPSRPPFFLLSLVSLLDSNPQALVQRHLCKPLQ